MLEFLAGAWRGPGCGVIGRLLGTAALVAAVIGSAAPVRAESPTPAKGAVIPIRDVINDITRESLERRIGEAQAAGASTLIFEMDTPGGAVTSALEICRLIKTLPPDVRTVAWVNPRAYSAGAMISLACREIWMSPSSAIGDCAPIMVSAEGVKEMTGTERAKAESPILQEFRESAARNGYDQLLARAMVTMGAEIWWLENVNDAKDRRFVTDDEKKKLVDDAPEGDRQWKLVEDYTNQASGKPVHLVQPIERADTLLTVGTDEAVAFGLARGVARSVGELTSKLELSGLPLRFAASGWEQFALWLNNSLIRGILFIIVIIGAYVEFQHPGLILPGVTAAVALVIFLAAPYAAGLANVWTFILLGIGLILLALEIFVLPGHGVSGILGVALIMVAVVGTFVPQEPGSNPNLPFSWPSLPGTWKALERGIQVLSGSVFVSVIGIVLILRYLPRIAVAQGVVAPNPEAAALAMANASVQSVRVGDIGVVTGDLRPGGQARFGQEVVDVQSQGEYVVAGRRVQIVKLEGMRVVVRQLPDERTA